MTSTTRTARAARRPSALERVNPVTPFAAAVVYSLPMLLTIDVVSAGVALVAWLIVLGAAGIGPRTVLRRAWPLLLAAPVSAVSMLLYAEPGGRIHAQLWIATVSDRSIELALAIGLRVLALGVPVLVGLVGLDPTRLADGLAQVARLPHRFVLAALAGVRLFGVLGEDWRQIALARRARGLGDTGAVRRALQAAFALLVVALRRGGTLATAMEARGFGGPERTWARPSTVGRADAVLLLITAGIVALALGASVATGSFMPVWAGAS
ncbi:energy-coupling factor transporter transmembrane component T family protein [Agrococcus carbonis]|uniref:Energy-coupling factor transport system permease protein n=1 Tax=Agrococcus carbonis TaxID=684552 RepID=A0A1H1L6I8_9MICO|nr:energy-coupling factor transporter transmembrane component T [Agrococcus carbonis]SDR69665.1 energy-coupling factor transport system permease protein [Agrococcus carbonis]